MKGKRKWVRMLALFATVLALPLTGRAVEEGEGQKLLDDKAACSLEVTVAGGTESGSGEPSRRVEQLSELQTNGSIAIDLYRVATLQKDGAYDKFTYEMLPDYSAVSVDTKSVEDAANGLLDREAAQEWSAIAQALAGVVKENASAATASGSAGTKLSLPENGDGESVGLYLMFVREKEKTLADSFVEVESDDGAQIATRVISPNYTYDFSPQLVAFPWMEKDAEGNSQYPWIYDREVNLAQKYTSDYRYGSIRIVKRLPEYLEGKSATFVFQVESQYNDVEDRDTSAFVYSDVKTLSFTAAGEDEILIEDAFPIGAQVTVTEVYSGSVYSNGGNAAQTLTVTVNDTAGTVTAEFTNRYNDSGNGGGSVVNSFEPNADGTGWIWKKDGVESGVVASDGAVSGRPASPTDQEGAQTPADTQKPETTENSDGADN